jgi:hypothetical protein
VLTPPVGSDKEMEQGHQAMKAGKMNEETGGSNGAQKRDVQVKTDNLSLVHARNYILTVQRKFQECHQATPRKSKLYPT